MTPLRGSQKDLFIFPEILIPSYIYVYQYINIAWNQNLWKEKQILW
jgi:hypothetical protein